MAAAILINAAPSPLLDAEPGDVVALANADNTGVTTWRWELLSRPPGSSASIASPTAAATTCALDCEGSYLFQLTTNEGTATVAVARGLAGVPMLRSGLRIPARSETREADPTEGWAPTLDAVMHHLDTATSNGVRTTAINGGAGTLAVGTVVRFDVTATVMSGLPGESRMPTVKTALASEHTRTLGMLGLVLGGVGTPGVGVPTGERAVVLLCGFAELSSSIVAAALTQLFVSDAGALDTVAGSTVRQVARVIAANGTTMTLTFNGLASADTLTAETIYLGGFSTPQEQALRPTTANPLYGPGILTWGNQNSGNAASTTTFVDPGFGLRTAPSAGAAIQTPTPSGGCRISRIAVRADFASAHDDTVTFTLWKWTGVYAATVLSVSLAPGVTYAEYTGLSVVMPATPGSGVEMRAESGPAQTIGVSNFVIMVEVTRE